MAANRIPANLGQCSGGMAQEGTVGEGAQEALGDLKGRGEDESRQAEGEYRSLPGKQENGGCDKHAPAPRGQLTEPFFLLFHQKNTAPESLRGSVS